MHFSLHFTRVTVKDLAARLTAALRGGQRSLVCRLTALQMVGQGLSVPIVARVLDLAESTLYGWVHDFLARGVASLAYRTSPGRPPKLTAAQKARLRDLLVAGPEAAGYPTGAWNTPLVADLIRREWGVEFNVHYLSALLASLGFSYQKARFVSDHLDEERRAAWLNGEWRAVVQRAAAQGALLLFGDEASFAQWGSLGYTWALRGEQPTVRTCGRRKGYKVWGVVDWFSGWLFTRGQEGRFTAASYCAFLEEVLAQTTQPIILVQDGARYHTAQVTQAWLAAHAERIEVVQLPSYSPDYNPIEHVWREVKEGTHCAYFATVAALVARVEDRLGQLRGNVAQVQQLLGTPLDAVSPVARQIPAAA